MPVLRFALLCFLVLIAVSLDPGQAWAQTDGETGALVWQDEFEDAGRPDTTTWRYETGFVRNRELQWYQPENAEVRDGHLVIEGRRETTVNPGYDSTSTDWRASRRTARYTSASLTARDSFAFKYGRLDVRARIPARDGLWPAIWTVGLRRGWPEGGEIDIMEYYQNSIIDEQHNGVRGAETPCRSSTCATG